MDSSPGWRISPSLRKRNGPRGVPARSMRLRELEVGRPTRVLRIMFPVICTVDMDAEFIDAFLRKTYKGYPEAAQELCIITTKNTTAYQTDESAPSPEEARQGALVRTQSGGPMKTPSRLPWPEDVQSVFRGQSAEEVAKEVRESFAGTELEIDYCVILDEKSLQDSTAIIARMKRAQSEDDPGFATVRQPFEEVNAALGAWSIGEGSLEEALEEGAPAC